MLQSVHGTDDMDKEKIIKTIKELEDIERAGKEGRLDEARDLTGQE